MRNILKAAVFALIFPVFMLGEANAGQSAQAGKKQVEAVIESIVKGDASAVKKGIASGVDINSRGDYGMTLLHVAAMNNQSEITRILVEMGADTRLKDDVGLLPEDRAASKEIWESIYLPPKRCESLKAYLEKVCAKFGKKTDAADRENQKFAAYALDALVDESYEIPRPRKVEQVEPSLFPDDNPQVSTANSKALVVERIILEEELPLLVLLYALEDNSTGETERLRALLMLNGTTDGRAVAALRWAAASTSASERLAALRSLGSAAGEAAADVFMGALSDAEPSIRAEGTRWLGDYQIRDARQKLQTALSDPDWAVRAEAARALGGIGGAAAVPSLISALGDNSTLAMREILGSLTLLQAAVPSEKILGILKNHKDRFTRECAANLAAAQDDSSACALLVEALYDAEPNVREAAAAGLASKKPKDPALVEKLLERTFTESENQVKAYLYPIAAEQAGEKAKPLFEKAYAAARASEDFTDQKNLLKAICPAYGDLALKFCREIFADKDSYLHNNAAAYLKTCPTVGAVDLLVEYFNHPYPLTRRLIFESLVYLTGRLAEYNEQTYSQNQEIPDSEAAAWKKWWSANRSKTDPAASMEKYKKEAAVQAEKGDALFKQDKVEEALECYKQAQFLDPDSPDIFKRISDILNAQKK
jgi:HEAT repeat protein